MSALSDLIGVLLPGGVAVGGVMIFQAIRSWREGKSSREETAIQRWQRLVEEAKERSEIAEQDEAYAIVVADHWRQRSADLEFEMRKAGLVPPPRPPMPKKVRGITRGQTRPRKRLVRNAEQLLAEEEE